MEIYLGGNEMSQIVYAILAHNNRECLKDLVESIQVFSTGSRIILFNGGGDVSFYEGMDIEVCPYSKPLKHGKLASFHYSIMKMLTEEKTDYEYLVTLDCDMLLIKEGFADFLRENMRSSLYMGVNFQKIEKGTEWLIGRRFLYKWKSKFQAYYSIKEPYGSFNPCQVFRREYVDRFVADPMTAGLLEAVEASKLEALEEIIYATYAMKIQGNPVSNPGSHALVLRRHRLSELLSYLQDKDVFFVHKIGMGSDDRDREFLRYTIKGTPPIHLQKENYETTIKHSFLRKKLSVLKDLYLILFA